MTGRMDAFLKAYCRQFSFKLASRSDFTGLLEEVTGIDPRPLLTDYLDTLI